MSLHGFAVGDILTELARFSASMSLLPSAKAQLFDKLADVEYRLAFGTSDKLQTASLVAAYHAVRITLKAAKDAAA